jgi:hypothetical protein
MKNINSGNADHRASRLQGIGSDQIKLRANAHLEHARESGDIHQQAREVHDREISARRVPGQRYQALATFVAS